MKKPSVSKKYMAHKHPAIPEAYNQLAQGRITRSEFLRFSTLLGLSAGVAYIAAACAAPPEEAAQPGAPSGEIKRGGTFTRAMELQQIDHPARFSWVQQANVVRQVAEYLTETGSDNITRPMLLEKWEASEDVKTWTLYLSKGVKFNNGDELTADDVMFNFNEWLNPDVGSSILSLMSYLSGPQDVEKVDDYTVKHAPDRRQYRRARAPVPLSGHDHAPQLRGRFHQAADRHRSVSPWKSIPKASARCSSAARITGAWVKTDNPLPYLDEIIYVSMAKDAAVAAVQGRPGGLHVPAARQRLAGLQGYAWHAGVDGAYRGDHRAADARRRGSLDRPPGAQGARRCARIARRSCNWPTTGKVDLGIDAHIAPVHPEYCDKPSSRVRSGRRQGAAGRGRLSRMA